MSHIRRTRSGMRCHGLPPVDFAARESNAARRLTGSDVCCWRCLLDPGVGTVVASPSHPLRRRGYGGRKLDAPTGTARAGLCLGCFDWLVLDLFRHWRSPFSFLQRASTAFRAISRRCSAVSFFILPAALFLPPLRPRATAGGFSSSCHNCTEAVVNRQG